MWCRGLVLAVAAAVLAAPASAGAQTLSYDYFKGSVQPIFLKKREGHTRCIVCHAGANNAMRLTPLERGATKADMEAFAFLHAHANHNALRRIERPDLPDAALDVLARGIEGRRLADGVMFVHLGAVTYPELIAQFADLFLQVEGAEWSVVSGCVNQELHISVRNVGYVRAAGDVVHEAFGNLGGAGGHRSMAKAVVKLRDWRAAGLSAGDREMGEAIASRFLAALRRGRG